MTVRYAGQLPRAKCPMYLKFAQNHEVCMCSLKLFIFENEKMKIKNEKVIKKH